MKESELHGRLHPKRPHDDDREVRIGFFGHGKTYEINAVDNRKGQSAIVIVAKTGLSVVPASDYDRLADMLRETIRLAREDVRHLDARLESRLGQPDFNFWREIEGGMKAIDLFSHEQSQREGRSFGPQGPVNPRDVASRMAFAAREALDVRPSAVEGVAPAPPISEESREREARPYESLVAAGRAGADAEVWDAVHRHHLTGDRVVVHTDTARITHAGHGAEGVIVRIGPFGFELRVDTDRDHSFERRWPYAWRDVTSVVRAPGQGPSDETCEREEREARLVERDRLDVDWLVYRWTDLKPKVPDEPVEVPEPVVRDAIHLLRDARVLRGAIKDITQLAILAGVIADIERTLGIEREERTVDEEITPGGEPGPHGPAKSLDISQLTIAIHDGDADKAAQLARELAEANRVPDFVMPMSREERHLVGLLRQLNGLDVTENTTEQLTAMVRTTLSTMWELVSDEPLPDPDAVVPPNSRERAEIESLTRLNGRLAESIAQALKRLTDDRTRSTKATKDQLSAAINNAASVLRNAPSS